MGVNLHRGRNVAVSGARASVSETMRTLAYSWPTDRQPRSARDEQVTKLHQTTHAIVTYG